MNHSSGSMPQELFLFWLVFGAHMPLAEIAEESHLDLSFLRAVLQVEGGLSPDSLDIAQEMAQGLRQLLDEEGSLEGALAVLGRDNPEEYTKAVAGAMGG